MIGRLLALRRLLKQERQAFPFVLGRRMLGL
jgi:hypothetical protein